MALVSSNERTSCKRCFWTCSSSSSKSSCELSFDKDMVAYQLIRALCCHRMKLRSTFEEAERGTFIQVLIHPCLNSGIIDTSLVVEPMDRIVCISEHETTSVLNRWTGPSMTALLWEGQLNNIN